MNIWTASGTAAVKKSVVSVQLIDMDVERPLDYVDFTTEKDFSKSKSHKKRKRVGNRIPIGEKAAKRLASQRTPQRPAKQVVEPESDVEESMEGTEL